MIKKHVDLITFFKEISAKTTDDADKASYDKKLKRPFIIFRSIYHMRLP